MSFINVIDAGTKVYDLCYEHDSITPEYSCFFAATSKKTRLNYISQYIKSKKDLLKKIEDLLIELEKAENYKDLCYLIAKLRYLKRSVEKTISKYESELSNNSEK